MLHGTGLFQKAPFEGSRKSFPCGKRSESREEVWERGAGVGRGSGNGGSGGGDGGGGQGLAAGRSFMGAPVGVLLLEARREP